ncbi:MAG TPA: hypothetical protein VK826_04380 [Bacteroidia bacterium]|nr:hypothetical protein [Bacteroidia bacterium]
MKNILLSLAMLLTFVQLRAQEGTIDSTKIARSTVYVELLGSGALYSLNYDRLFLKKDAFGLSARVGLSYMTQVHSFYIPVAINGLWGKRNHHLELSAGVTFILIQDENNILKTTGTEIAYVPAIGYRFQKNDGGFFFRLVVLKFFPVEESVVIWGGLGLGYTFKHHQA